MMQVLQSGRRDVSVQSVIECKLREALPCDVLEVVNESHMHRGPADAETHFRLTVVSAAFEGVRSVARHQRVYGALQAELAAGVHALALHTYTPAEWQARQAETPASPRCLGGGGR
jgi:BolA protein